MKHLTAKEIEKMIVLRGWIFGRMRGSHAQYDHPNIPGHITIPFHGNRPLPDGTQRGIMRQAGITCDEL